MTGRAHGCLAVVVVACAAPAVSAAPATAATWLCNTALASNPCEASRAATAVAADGTTSTEKPVPAGKPPVDCFYVYPTVSHQPGTNADLTIDPEERAVAILQASRFSQVCRVFAPMYPQLTLSAIFTPGGITPAGAATAYGGVLSAFQDYLKCCNKGRGIVFIGHSQGSSLLVPLLRNEVDGKPDVRRRLVSALLVGTNVTVRDGKRVGGSFTKIPACRSAREAGCVVSYVSFDRTPPANSNFGRVGTSVNPFEPTAPGLRVLCVNPAAPGGGSGTLQPYFRATPDTAPTPWIAYPGLYKARCKSAGGATWLQIDHRTRPGDKRPVVSPPQGPEWGLHIYDVNLAVGNLVGLVSQQASAYLAGR